MVLVMVQSDAEPADGRETSPADSLISENYISDDEWEVEDILAERVMQGDALGRPAGERCWLVKWTGFQLAEATWEPQEHLADVLLQRWEEEKQKHLAGTKKPFKVRDWKRACMQFWQKKIEKQKALNKERKRDKQEPYPVDCILAAQESLNSVDSEYESDDDVNWAELDRDAEIREDSSEASIGTSRETTPASSESDFEPPATEEEAHQEPPQETVEVTSGMIPTSAPGTSEPTPHKTDYREAHEAEDSVKTTATISSQRGSQKNTEKTKILVTQQSSENIPRLDAVPEGTSSEKQPKETGESISPGAPGYVKHAQPAARAKKTRQPASPETAGNVFVGGSKPRTRPTLEKAAKMPSAGPRLLSLRYQNILNKRSRDDEGIRDPRLAQRARASTHEGNDGQQTSDAMNEDASLFVTPDPDTRPDDPSTDQDIHLVDEESRCPDTTQLPETEAGHSTQPSLVSEAVGGASDVPMYDVQNSPAPSKRRKSVHFGDDEPESMDLDGDEDMVIVPEDVPSETVSQPSLRNVTKRCQIGSSTHIVEITFIGISGEVLTTHLSEFENSQALTFNHQCSEEDFVFYRPTIQASVVAEGYVQSNDMPNALRHVNTRLVTHRRALLCYINGLCILLVPNTSSKPSFEGFNLNTSVSSEEPAFVIFRPAEGFTAQSLDAINLEKLATVNQKHPQSGLSLDRLLRFQCGRLLPRSLSSRPKDSQIVFFMLFPLSREDEGLVLAKWLRQCDASCEVLSSFVEGHWSMFKSLDSGVVILHQEAIEMFRLLPDIGKLLWSSDSTSNFSFWTFGTGSQQDQPGSEVDTIECHENPERVALKLLLPAGTVFLLTPSFLLAQPESAYRFLKWFSQKFIESPVPTGPVCKLAFSGSPDRWMAELIEDVIAGSTSREEGCHSLDEEITVRLKMERLVRKMLSRTDPENPDLLTSPLILAPDCIDGNDEQSLVNWFSWWATTHLDMFRRFEVVGTGFHDRFRLDRRVRAPHYHRSSIVDPEAPVETDEAQAPIRPVRAVRPLALREAAATMQEGLNCIERERLSQMPLAILFRRPVCYFAPGMAVQWGDAGSRLATFDEWFSFFLPLRHISGKRNTYVGLFYTTDTEWDPEAHPADIAPPCRPWFAIFRPQNPHRKPWTSTELLIWDPFLGRQFTGSDQIFESDLIPAQRRLISTVALKNREKNPQALLEAVWIGGFESSDLSSEPVKDTIKRLDQLFENFKSDLDARSDRLPKGGWKAVKSGARPVELQARSASPKTQHPTPFTVGESDTEDDKTDRKIVFHPPRGDKKLYSRQLENRLLKETQKAKDAKKGPVFEFRFAPTLQWHGYLKPLKRHSEHVRVVRWTTIFSELGLPIRQH